MNARPRILAILSADFGEFVNLAIFSRNQAVDVEILAPSFLTPFLTPAEFSVSSYHDFGDVLSRLTAFTGELVWLGSAHLYIVNGLMSPDQFETLLEHLTARNMTTVTTDPWARVWSLRPDANFQITRRGKVDVEASAQFQRYQQHVESLLADIPHVFPVPINRPQQRWFGYFNAAFTRDKASSDAVRNEATRRWLFVLSNEDLTVQTQTPGLNFSENLSARLRELLTNPCNELTLVAPERLGPMLDSTLTQSGRLRHVPRIDAVQFEALIRDADVTVYWNLLSASLMYCLYYQTPVMFYAEGHQTTLCPALKQHALDVVYPGRRPLLLDIRNPLQADADTFLQQHDLAALMQEKHARYATNPPAEAVLEHLMNLNPSAPD